MGNALLINQKEQIKELLDSAESIGIIVSENQNIDSVAGALGLYLVLKANGKNVQVVSKREPIVELSNLVGIDKVSKSFVGNTKNLTISVPYREGEIEKVSYNIEGTRLNVNLFAENSGISFNESDIQYIRKGSSPSLIITIGVSNENELEGLVDIKTIKTIHLDKNPMNSLFGDVSIIDPGFSSLSEIVSELIMELSLGYDLDAFQNLMDGITYATRNFTLPVTSPFAFEAAGFLLQNGAKRKERSQGRPFDSQRKPFEQKQRRDERFPKEEHFLKQRPKPQGSRPWQNPSRNDNPQASSVPIQPRVTDDVNQFDQSSPSIEEVETIQAPAGEIPEDWFLPKVFKGSRKGN